MLALALLLLADPWAALVEKQATREQVAAALGKPEIEFTAFVEKGEKPLQISPSLPGPPEFSGEWGAGAPPTGRAKGGGTPTEPDEWAPDYADDELVRVMEYRGRRRGLAYQVVLKDEKVWYAVAPPLADEESFVALA